MLPISFSFRQISVQMPGQVPAVCRQQQQGPAVLYISARSAAPAPGEDPGHPGSVSDWSRSAFLRGK